MRAIIDGDELLYRVALSYQKVQYYVKRDDERLYNVPSLEYGISAACEDERLDVDKELLVRPLENYEERLDFLISRILALTKSTDYIICVSGNNNFRYTLATLLPYKGNREGGKPPFHLAEIKKRFKAEYDNVCSDENEADEMMVFSRRDPLKEVICSSDKDLRTVHGMNYDIGKRKLKYISEQEARYNFYYQLLIGDSTDNIPSPYLLGPKSATKILEELDHSVCTDLELYNHVKEAYRPYLEAVDKDGEYKTKWYKGQDIDYVLWEVANLLWMEHSPGGKSRWERPT